MKVKKEQRQRQQNKKYRTLIKNSFKDVEKISSGENSENNILNLENALKYAQKIIDKAARKGLIHKKNAARKVGRAFSIVNSFKQKSLL